MLDRSDHGLTYTRIPQSENEGFHHIKKINRKQFFILCFTFLVFACYIVNQYVYQQSSFDSFPETTPGYGAEKFIQKELSEARKKYKKYLELANSTVNDQNETNSETSGMNNDTNAVKNMTLTTNKLSRIVFAKLKDIERSATNIFFLETRCATETNLKEYLNNTGFILNARQCCSIESTAFMNLDRKVYIFHSCPISDDFIKHSPKFVEKLFNYPNLYLVRLNTTEMFNNTPLQELYEKRLLETSLYPTEHTSDLIRLLVLWRFGGTYSDIDVVTIRSFNILNYNWAGSQDAETIANGVMNFEPDGPGHEMLQQALEHVNKHFDGTQWSTNGPLLITPIILKECQATTVEQAVNKCKGDFTVWLPPVLYPVYYNSWELYFRDDVGKQIVEQVKGSAFSVHIWNKMSRDGVIRVGSTQAYGLLASEYCSEVYQNCGDTF